MDQIPTLLESEYRDCRRLLYDDIMCVLKKQICTMRVWALEDSANLMWLGGPSLSNRDNKHLAKDANTTLLTAVKRSDHLLHNFLTKAGASAEDFTWRENAISSYEATAHELLKRRYLLIHVSGGQAVRETGSFEMTWRNTQRRRSITLGHEKVMIYVKLLSQGPAIDV